MSSMINHSKPNTQDGGKMEGSFSSGLELIKDGERDGEKRSLKVNEAEVSVIMGSKSDYETMKHIETILKQLAIKFEILVISAHRTPDRMFKYAKEAKSRGIKIIIAGAGGAAHLPGMVAALTELPVIGVPVKSAFLNGVDSLLSIVQMPFGVPVATVAIGEAGAKNAALLAAKILALANPVLAVNLANFISKQSKSVPMSPSETIEQNI